MTNCICHRGPDDEGIWVEADSGVALGFRRLAILDLSEAGHQPMVSASGRFVAMFNGEIYNYLDLRKELDALGHRFRGHSDTEVMLAAIEQWGFDATIPRLNGMFAIVVWDRHERTLRLARDHFGIKPLYYGWSGGALLFGSELKSFHKHPSFRANIDRASLAQYFRLGYVPSPGSIFEGVYKLPAGSTLTLTDREVTANPKAYWSIGEVAERGVAHPFAGSDAEAEDAVDALLADAVRLQMVSDVPLGAFLSGGIDSSLVVALMQRQSTKPVRTFSIGFEVEGFDEAPHAKAVAAHLGTDHTEHYVTEDQVRNMVARMPEIYDEPFADGSGLPTTLLSEMTRRDVTVSLSGDGGDEIFGGYKQYWRVAELWRKAESIPGPLRNSGVANAVRGVGNALGGTKKGSSLSSRLTGYANYFAFKNPDDLIRYQLSNWHFEPNVVCGAPEANGLFDRSDDWPKLDDIVQRFMFLDTALVLPDRMLTKVDRASSSASLEARVPLLDPRVAELAWSLPARLKNRSSTENKFVLRQVLSRYVPSELYDRPKQGFAIPVAEWLRGPLKPWADELLDPVRLRKEGLLKEDAVTKRWRGLRDGGDARAAKDVWIALMFQAWKQRWMPQ